MSVNKSALMFLLYRNESIDLQCKSIDLYLLGGNIAAYI